ncbi:MAG: succinyl-diaminopimelate desuccinylase [Thermotogota bacterium]|nr:succinyl-diaminopimelate desuccinylase [Thermotogota bacterium]
MWSSEEILTQNAKRYIIEHRQNEEVCLLEAKRLKEKIESYRDEMVKTLMEFVSINSVNPAFGGPGELKKAEWLESKLKDMGFEFERYDAEDERAEGGVRPNLVVKTPGKDSSRTLWFVSHTDVVPEGDRALWKKDPFEPYIENGRIYGRGSEDNGGSLVASLFALKALVDLGIEPQMNTGLVFVADEEAGSERGIRFLINKNIFKEKDLFVVPDAGVPDGSFVEIAEKSILWLRFTVSGKQVHASTPNLGLNASRVAMNFLSELDRLLHEVFPMKDESFSPPESTFEPTKRLSNVDNVNTVPGSDISFFDCRVLPQVKLDDVLEVARSLAAIHSRKTGAEIKVDVVQRHDAPEPTPKDSEAVTRLSKAIESCRGVKPVIGGIGGGTCAAHFREKGWHAVVWSTIEGTAHQPNENKRIEDLIADALVFAFMMAE